MTGKIPKVAPLRPPLGHPVTIKHWPTERCPEGLGMSVRDGWNWGIGFGLAMAIAVPLILLVFTCAIWMIISFLGVSLGALL